MFVIVIIIIIIIIIIITVVIIVIIMNITYIWPRYLAGLSRSRPPSRPPSRRSSVGGQKCHGWAASMRTIMYNIKCV